MPAERMDDIVALSKRRGFIFPSSDVYGGLQGIYDYGPLGVELKNNLKSAWWQAMLYARDDIEGLDSAILTNKLVLRHSGHEETFVDPMVDCRQCKSRFRADHIVNNRCENCGSTDLTPPRPFNMMFKTAVGPVADADSYAYLRPETAQGIFTNFKNIIDSTSRKLPFGVAQIGKAFRNEITPRNFIFRVREFEQMELEFFVAPGTDEKWHSFWVEERIKWWQEQGLKLSNLKPVAQEQAELSHYAKATVDLIYEFPHGPEELEGIANRTDYDLGSHSKNQPELNISAKVKENTDSTARLAVQDLASKQWVVPYVIEPSAGLDRGVLAILTEAYTEEVLADGKKRVVLKLKNHLAPVKVAVIPLAKNNPELVEYAKKIKSTIQKLKLGKICFEDTGNIGKAYRKHDEIGTPICITVDFASIGKDGPEQKDTVTIRERDSMHQHRINITELPDYIKQAFA